AVIEDPRWAAVATRDAAQDGRFYYAVRTTGVVCRPSCRARTPRPENVTFHATLADAVQAGYRPCKRCRPGEPSRAERQAREVASLCRFLEEAESPPRLEEL